MGKRGLIIAKFIIYAVVLLVCLGISFAYDTVGVRVDPYSFNEDNLVELRWKADVYEFESNPLPGQADPLLRLEWNTFMFRGNKGQVPAGIWIQNTLHHYGEGSCSVTSYSPGLGLYFYFHGPGNLSG